MVVQPSPLIDSSSSLSHSFTVPDLGRSMANPDNPAEMDTVPEVDQAPPKPSFLAKLRKPKKQAAPEEGEPRLPPVKFITLFKYAERSEIILMLIAFVAAAAHGSLMPLFSVLFGEIINKFTSTDDSGGNLDQIPVEEITAEIGSVAKYFLILAAVAFVTSFIQVRLQVNVAHRICGRLRRMFFRSLMSQDYAWYDKNNGGELTARVAGDVNIIQNGIGDKLSSAVQFMAMFVIGIIIAFVYGPLLTLVILAVAPLLALAGGFFAKMAAQGTGDQLGAYGKAGAIASEVIGLIRTVTAYGGQKEEAARYEKELDSAYKANIRQSVYSGLGLGITFFIIFSTYAIAFAFGASRVSRGDMEPGSVLTTFFSVLIASFSIGQGRLLANSAFSSCIFSLLRTDYVHQFVHWVRTFLQMTFHTVITVLHNYSCSFFQGCEHCTSCCPSHL